MVNLLNIRSNTPLSKWYVITRTADGDVYVDEFADYTSMTDWFMEEYPPEDTKDGYANLEFIDAITSGEDIQEMGSGDGTMYIIIQGHLPQWGFGFNTRAKRFMAFDPGYKR